MIGKTSEQDRGRQRTLDALIGAQVGPGRDVGFGHREHNKHSGEEQARSKATISHLVFHWTELEDFRMKRSLDREMLHQK